MVEKTGETVAIVFKR